MPRIHIPVETERRVRAAARNRCGYCLSPQHFRWSEDGLSIIGMTPIGRATVATLHLSDDPDALEVRSYWVSAGWHPPED